MKRRDDTSATEEWFEVISHLTGKVEGLIPRSVAESLGVDCRAADREPRGAIWFTSDQSKAIHKHPRWAPIIEVAP